MKHPVVAAALVTGAVVLAVALGIRGTRGVGVEKRLAGPSGEAQVSALPSRDGGDVSEDLKCVTRRTPVEVRGTSLGALAPPGTKLTLLEGFYRCNEVRRGDWVALHYAGDVRPLVKVVHGIAGDRLALTVTPRGERLLVNGEPARNSQGVPYRIDAAADRLLAQYVRGYRGVIPQDALLVFGDQPERTVDSRRFGLVARSDLLGKLVPAR